MQPFAKRVLVQIASTSKVTSVNVVEIGCI
jgi:hypothetical protein